MKYILILLIVIVLGVTLITTKFNSSKSLTEKKPEIKLTTKIEAGKILGETVKQVEQELQLNPQKIIEQTATSVVNQITSDAASLSNNIINSIISQQLLNSYKNLSPEAKIHVQEAVCK